MWGTKIYLNNERWSDFRVGNICPDLVEHNDVIRLGEHLQLVRDEDASFVFEKAGDGFLEEMSCHVGVDGRQRIVQQVHVSFFVQGPAQRINFMQLV